MSEQCRGVIGTPGSASRTGCSPGWEISAFGGTVPLAAFVPQAVVGGFLAAIALWPFLESLQPATGDRRPARAQPAGPAARAPTRTGLAVAGIVFFVTLWVSGTTDLVTTRFGVAFEHEIADHAPDRVA